MKYFLILIFSCLFLTVNFANAQQNMYSSKIHDAENKSEKFKLTKVSIRSENAKTNFVKSFSQNIVLTDSYSSEGESMTVINKTNRVSSQKLPSKQRSKQVNFNSKNLSNQKLPLNLNVSSSIQQSNMSVEKKDNQLSKRKIISKPISTIQKKN